MAGVRWPLEESELLPPRPPTTADLISDDDRSVAADSWSIKSEYGSTLDDEQRHVDAAEVLAGGNFPATAASDYSSDKDEPDASEVEASMLGFQSYWDASYAEDLANFHEHGHAGEIWRTREALAILESEKGQMFAALPRIRRGYFRVLTCDTQLTVDHQFGVEVMDTVATWTKILCANLSQGWNATDDSSFKTEIYEAFKDLSSWRVLDIGSGNGLLLQELAKHGFSDLTGTDYSEGAIDLARNLAIRDGFPHINFLVDDVLETKLNRKFDVVMDKGTLDAIGLHPDGPVKRIVYWESVSNLVAPGGVLVITSCNNTKDELLQEVEKFNKRRHTMQDLDQEADGEPSVFHYLDHVRTYPTIMFGGLEGPRVCTVAFLRN